MTGKYLRPVLALVLIVGMALASMMARAQEPAQDETTLNDWFTSVTFQNVTTTTNNATLTIEAYAGEGSTAAPVTPDAPVTIAPGANNVFLPGLTDREGFINMTLPEDFVGGIRVASNEPIVAISQVGNNLVGSVGNAAGGAIGQYRGSSTPDTTISYPAAKNGLGSKLTVFSIQATDGEVGYLATILSNSGETYTKTGSIAANRTALLFPATFSRGGLPGTDCGFSETNPNWIDTSPCIGSLTIQRTSGSGSLVGTVIETRSDIAIQNVGQAASLFTSSAGATTVYCPVVKYESGSERNTSGVTIQNLGPGDVTVQMTTALIDGGTATASISIPENAARTLFGATLGFDPGVRQFGAATLRVTEGTGNIIAAVNESNVTVATLPNQKQVTYTCFSAADAGETVAFPLVKERFGDPQAATSINLQNIASTGGEVAITVAYICDTGNVDIPVSIGPGAGTTLFLTSGQPINGEQVPLNSNCAATATAPTGSQIIGYTQDTSDLSFVGGSDSILDIRNYEGF